MPGMDGSGPDGKGPFGRGRGPCGSGQASGSDYGRGRGFRRGGRGWNRFAGPMSPEEETRILESEKNWLEERVEAIKQRLSERQ